MIDWDQALHGAVAGVFGAAVTYRFADGGVLTLADAIHREPFAAMDPLADPSVLSVRPTLGVRLAAMPPGWDCEAAQGDTWTTAAGKAYVVKAGRPSGSGWALLEGSLQ